MEQSKVRKLGIFGKSMRIPNSIYFIMILYLSNYLSIHPFLYLYLCLCLSTSISIYLHVYIYVYISTKSMPILESSISIPFYTYISFIHISILYCILPSWQLQQPTPGIASEVDRLKQLSFVEPRLTGVSINVSTQ